MKEHTSTIIRSNITQQTNMKLVKSNKYKSNCFHIKCYCSVINSKKNVFAFKHSTLLVIIVIIVMFGGLCVVESKNTTSKDKEKDTSDISKCTHCHRNESRTIAIVSIQTKILLALGYENVPPRGIYTNKIKYMGSRISKLMEAQYNETTEHHAIRHQSNDIQDENQPFVLQHEEFSEGELCSNCPPWPYDNIHTPILFRFGSIAAKNDNYKSVSLVIWVNNSEDCRELVNISVYQLVCSSDGSQSYKLVKNSSVSSVHPDPFITINVQDEVINHKLAPGFTDNITFVPVLTYANKRPAHCPDLSRENGLYSVLKFQYDDKAKKRSKRTPAKNDCTENSTYTDCCRYPLTVDFDDMKWDFIITPRKYEAYLCDGECPLLYKQDLPHTHLLQQMKTKARAGPCCSPKQMNSINMLYITPRGTILYAKVAGMVVEKCGCS